MQSAQVIAEILIGLAKEQEVQIMLNGGGWKRMEPQTVEFAIQSLNFGWALRLAPLKQKRLITIEELPPMFWVSQSMAASALCTGLHIDGRRIRINAEWWTIHYCAVNGWLYSADRKEWKSFEVEENP